MENEEEETWRRRRKRRKKTSVKLDPVETFTRTSRPSVINRRKNSRTFPPLLLTVTLRSRIGRAERHNPEYDQLDQTRESHNNRSIGRIKKARDNKPQTHQTMTRIRSRRDLPRKKKRKNRNACGRIARRNAALSESATEKKKKKRSGQKKRRKKGAQSGEITRVGRILAWERFRGRNRARS